MENSDEVPYVAEQGKGVIVYKIGDRQYILDEAAARSAFMQKRVINGRNSSEFNVLPLKYSWAYELYRKMDANHWIPHEIPMFDDVAQWSSSDFLNSVERNIVKFGLGYFSASEGLIGDCGYSVIRENLCAPELKMVVGRHVHEENIHTDSLLYMISSLGINPHEVNAMFLSLDSIKDKNSLIMAGMPYLKKDIDLTQTKNKKLFAKAIFSLTQVMEGAQFWALFLPILHLCRLGKMPGIGQMFRYTLRDETNHIELGRCLLLDLFREEPDILDDAFVAECSSFLVKAMDTEFAFVDDLLPQSLPGLSSDELKKFVCYNANVRLIGLGWNPIVQFDGDVVLENPLDWASEVIYLKKNESFFETRVTEYSKSSKLHSVDEESDLFEGISC
ncbi:ribonucleotide-diphosphate reductase subunit beta [Candidatus Similichlamydia epinepheli]|uniref:ribonucleotide-diphosphate reductase subunit beta n=1 Tax=Candidatus Similichlamydia epinepheli TaxID=1903953 RepID=UPI000D35F555|nr:ribonucleotide-diphosphate reductase subunit beta [Candidatus Similichlamydia epinepheli]